MLRRRLMQFAFVLLGLYFIVTIAACISMRRFLYHPPDPPRRTVASPPSRLLEDRSNPQQPVVILHAPAPPGARTVVYFHGNATDVGGCEWIVETLRQRGLGAAVVEYPGYGLARPATTTETTIYETAERALRLLQSRAGLTREDTVLAGESLGSGVAAEMALRGLGSRLVLLSPYTSMVDVVQRIVMILPAGLLVRDRYETAAKATRIRMPVLLLHGAEDTLIPPEMSATLARIFPNARRVLLPGRGHNDLWDSSLPGGDRALQELLDFSRAH